MRIYGIKEAEDKDIMMDYITRLIRGLPDDKDVCIEREQCSLTVKPPDSSSRSIIVRFSDYSYGRSTPTSLEESYGKVREELSAREVEARSWLD